MFYADSVKIFMMDKNAIYKLPDVQMAISTMEEQAKRNEAHNYQPLYDHLEQLKVELKYGKYYFDEFSKELIRKKERSATIPYLEYLENGDKYKTERIYKGYKNSKNRRAHKLAKKYGWSNEDCLRIVKRLVWIGMTDEMCRLSWGKPKNINRTVTSRTVKEQWVYGDGYYTYFDNGILTTYQN